MDAVQPRASRHQSCGDDDHDFCCWAALPPEICPCFPLLVLLLSLTGAGRYLGLLTYLHTLVRGCGCECDLQWWCSTTRAWRTMRVKSRLSSVVSLRRPSRVNSLASSTADLVVLPSRENSLSGLPEEILLDILLLLRHSSNQASFVPYLLCCRRWYRICQPLLYRDVLLLSGSRNPESNDEYARKDRARLGHRVGAFTAAARRHDQYIRSVTIRTASCNIEWPKWRPLKMLDRRKSERNHWYPALCRTLPLLRNLTTFSLKIGDNGARVFWTPQGKVTDILDALPPTLLNLEVDTMGADFATAGPSTLPSHICASLSRLLPRLQSLRLRLRFLCEDMFNLLDSQLEHHVNDDDSSPASSPVAPTSSRLRRAVIVFTPRLGTIGSQSSLLQTRLCGTFERPQHGEVFDLMSRRCKALCAAGKFPQLERFKLVDRTSGAGEGFGYDVYDLVADEEKNVTWATAHELFGGEEDSSLLQSVESPAGGQAPDDCHVRLADLAEGEAGWCDSSWQSRRPSADVSKMSL